MARLVIGSGAEAKSFELSEATITVGRAPENTIQIEEPSVSGRHARLLRDGEQFRLFDLDSTNGTRVNGETVKEATLRAGDAVQFGKVEARFEAEAVATPLPPPQIAASAVTAPSPSPLPPRRQPQDSLAKISYAAAALAMLAFLIAMIAVAFLRAPL